VSIRADVRGTRRAGTPAPGGFRAAGFPSVTARGTLSGMQDIKELIPHREPFLFVDRLEKADKDEVIGFRKFTDKDFFFAGHFPKYPVVPGVILIETMAQCGGAGVRIVTGNPGLFFLAAMEKAKFRRPVKPGEEVRMVIQNLRVTKQMVRQAGKAYVGDELAAEAEWLCLIGGPDLPA
jgi:3-hydroxyacyl-[acyl-carrier-protein] dehydratase